MPYDHCSSNTCMSRLLLAQQLACCTCSWCSFCTFCWWSTCLCHVAGTLMGLKPETLCAGHVGEMQRSRGIQCCQRRTPHCILHHTSKHEQQLLTMQALSNLAGAAKESGLLLATLITHDRLHTHNCILRMRMHKAMFAWPYSTLSCLVILELAHELILHVLHAPCPTHYLRLCSLCFTACLKGQGASGSDHVMACRYDMSMLCST